MPSDLESAVAAALGSAVVGSRAVEGGCVHDARELRLDDGRRVFVKSGRGAAADWLAAEERGLALIAPHIRCPARIAGGIRPDGLRWLTLEWLDLRPHDSASWEAIGLSLARLHAVTAPCHGLNHNNFIGATPQKNDPRESWAGFFIECRLQPQLALARRHAAGLDETSIVNAAARLLDGHEPSPALLHGDLWSGNTAALHDGTAVVFDPAPYFGDPETDLAMLELFGGPLPAAFLHGYGPTAPDRERRKPLYNLYHALNHLNLFGTGYLGMVRARLREIDGAWPTK